MASGDERAHGVTPGLRQDYAERTAERQAAFVLPLLRPGLHLLDLGCGPGTITIGLARAVAPGLVVGIDHDDQHVEQAKELAAAEGVDNVTFHKGDVLALPMAEATFDAAFENDLFVHLAEQAGLAATEVFRVLRPGGWFAARDADASAAVWGHLLEPMRRFDDLFIAWHQSRGSDVTLGTQLPGILREAGFTRILKTVSADTKGDPTSTRMHATIATSLLEGAFGHDIVEWGWSDPAEIARMAEAVRAWGEHPDAFFADVHIEVVGWKPS